MAQPRARIEREQVDKKALYDELCLELGSLLGSERDPIANAANTAALLFDALPDVNWVGFYYLKDGKELVVGPFQGKPACVRIPVGRGVCGAAAERKQSIVVADVHAFPDHITCDVASRSELVVPLMRDGAVLGVLDLDSPKLRRFDDDDRSGLERIAAIYVAASSL